VQKRYFVSFVFLLLKKLYRLIFIQSYLKRVQGSVDAANL